MHTSGVKIENIERTQTTVYEDWAIVKKKDLPIGSTFIGLGDAYGVMCELYACFGKLYAIILNIK